MRSLLVVGVTSMAALGLGRVILDFVLRRKNQRTAALNPGESAVFATALGLGTVAYGVLAIGLCGVLTPVSIGAWLCLAGMVGAPGLRSTWRELRALATRGSQPATASGESAAVRWLSVTLIVILAALLLIAVAACYQAPGPNAWDALAYHLADPKVFLQQHRIAILPTEHHSNFPFTMEMLFTIGLAFDGYAAANLFHLLNTVLLVLGLICFCNRYLSRLAGLIAAVVLATTPLVLWEATIAYIDLALALYVFLSAYMTILAAQTEAPTVDGGPEAFKSFQLRAMMAAGAMMGFALGIKYLALLPLVFLALVALLRRLPLRCVVAFVSVAAVIGSPWYIKNFVWMHNPVYPFAFNIFPGSKYWSADRAAPYADEQRSFGTAHDIDKPLESLRNLVVTPWKLMTSRPRLDEQKPELYTNPANFTFTSLIGGLYAGFILSLAFVRGKPRSIGDVAILLAAMFLSWFFVSQHIRYLVPALPFGAVLCGYAADRWMRGARWLGGETVVDHRLQFVNDFGGLVAVGAVFGQVAVLGWGITALPVSGREAGLALEAGLEPTALSAPEVVVEIVQPGERERHLRRMSSYGAVEWLNKNTPKRAGVILYEDVLGYYLDRPYIWGNGEHSSYIPYDSFRTGNDLTRWLRDHDIHYALFNLNGSPFNKQMGLLPDDPDSIAAILREWYDPTDVERVQGWRRTVSDAIQSGAWPVRYTHHGVAVLEIGADGK